MYKDKDIIIINNRYYKVYKDNDILYTDYNNNKTRLDNIPELNIDKERKQNIEVETEEETNDFRFGSGDSSEVLLDEDEKELMGKNDEGAEEERPKDEGEGQPINSMALVNKRVINAHKYFVSKNKAKSALNGVFIENYKNHVVSVSTDGFCMLKIESKREETDEYPDNVGKKEFQNVVISHNFLDQAVKILPRKSNIPLLENVLVHGDGVFSTDLQNKYDGNTEKDICYKATYPQYKGLIDGVNERKPVVEVNVNVDLLRKVCEGLSKLKLADNVIKLSIPDDNMKPIKITGRTIDKSDQATALIMPVLTEGDYND